MGYYTNFEFSTKNNKYKVSDIAYYMKKEAHKSDKYYPFKNRFDEYLFEDDVFDIEMDSNGECKWYEHNEEMIELSKQFPETVFCLYGNGEENGDTWYQYYKNGKSQYCPAKISYDEYDESKLA